VSTSPDLSQILKTVKIQPAKEDLKPTRAPRNKGVPELDPDVLKSYETGQSYDIGPVPEDYAHTIKLALQKSARYLSAQHNEDIRVTVQNVRLGDGTVRVRFEAHAPKMMGRAVVAAREAQEARRRKRRRGT
jgi:hypothetical protein